MAQHLADVRQCRPLLQHLHSQRVAKLMRACTLRLDPGARNGACDHLADIAMGFEAIERGPRAQEHPPAGRVRPAMFKIGGDGLSHIMRQWQGALRATLSGDAQTAALPVDIFQFELDNFSGPQSEAGQQEQDGAIAQAPGVGQFLLASRRRLTCAAGIALGIEAIDQPATEGTVAARSVSM